MELLNKIQQELKAPKGQYNSFSKFYYRSCEDIVEAVKPLLGKNGTLTLSDEMVEVGGRVYVKATATLKQEGLGSSGGSASATGWAREALDRKGMDDSQITGATSSYARKYALNGLFLIDDSKDVDSEDVKSRGIAYPKMTAANDSGPLDAPVAAKKAPPVNVDPKRVLAAKDRIKKCLELLGHDDMKTPQDYQAAVWFELGNDVDLVAATDLASLEGIGQALSEKVSKMK